MCYILHRSPVQLIDITASAGGGDGAIAATAGTLNKVSDVVAGPFDFTIPGGAYKLVIWNTGLTDVTVAGEVIPAGQKDEQEHALNKTNNKQDFTAARTVSVPADGEVTYLAFYPSA